MSKNLVIIVTHNSEKFIDWCVKPLIDSGMYDIRIVDSGSTDTSYLNKYKYKYKDKAKLYFCDNIGFAKANNIALDNISCYKWILFLNPDARIESETSISLFNKIDRPDFQSYGYLSVPLISYDIEKRKDRGFYDSLGIKCSLLGRWYDVSAPVTKLNPQDKNINVFCGAFILVRRSILETFKNESGDVGFENKLKMYKEDIEICLRLKNNNIKSKLLTDLHAYHCRGWDKKRSKVPFWAKYQSAVNDVYIANKYKKRALPFAYFKLLYVKLFERADK